MEDQTFDAVENRELRAYEPPCFDVISLRRAIRAYAPGDDVPLF